MVSSRLWLFFTGSIYIVGLYLPTAATFAQSPDKNKYAISAQFMSLAPNAGGQTAYSLKLGSDQWEVGAFSNQYITAGSLPFSGVTYDWRFPICSSQCFWQFFIQFGGGGSNGGPLIDLSWGTMIPLLPIWLPFPRPNYIPALRLDITTQLVLIRWRAVNWSYPLWIGISLPF